VDFIYLGFLGFLHKKCGMIFKSPLTLGSKVFQISTVRHNWPMSAHASQAFSIAHCTDSEDLPTGYDPTTAAMLLCCGLSFLSFSTSNCSFSIGKVIVNID